MTQIYDERDKQGLSDEPYLLAYTSTAQSLTFFGSRHVNDPEDKQFTEIESLWDQFLDSPGKKMALCEGGLRSIEGKTKDEAIRLDGDPGFICWLANQAGIEVISPEPDRALEVRELVGAFGSRKTALYYFVRRIYQWARTDFRRQPNINHYIESFIETFPKDELESFEMTLENLFELFKEETGKELSLIERATLSNLKNPGKSEVATKSSEYRNETIFEMIRRYKTDGYSVFAVYGSGHAIVLEPALKALYSA